MTMNRRYRDLTARQQDRISFEVGQMMATMRGDSPASIIQYAIDAYMDVVGDDLIIDAVEVARDEILREAELCPGCEERKTYIAEAIEALKAAV